MTKKELKDVIYSPKNKSGYYTRESVWKKSFTELYNDLLSWGFPCEFTFQQKIYHYLNNDQDLLLGRCLVCGKRCMFKGIVGGYCHFCSHKCSSGSDEYMKKRKETCLERYGVENPFQSEEVKNKIKEVCLERYGVEHAAQSEEIRERMKQTCLDKYGVENYTNRDKAKQTCLEKYGVENPFQSEEVKNKIKETCLDRYGVDRPLQSKEIREKTKQTCLDKYGVKNPFQSNDFKEKYKETCLDKYGVENYTQTEEFKRKFDDREWVKSVSEKCYQTKKENNSFSSSKIEDQLKEYFDLNNIKYIPQYKSDKYPFSCDFYFPDRDLYVEIQGSWTHGHHPFTGSEEDMNTLRMWESKGTKYYENAIDVWTIRDVKKRETAKKNNLNYLEIFSCDLDECIYKINVFLNEAYY